MAIKRAIREKYLDEKGLEVSKEEIEEVILSYVADHPDMETKEEYFEFMAMQEVDQEEVVAKIKIIISLGKLFEKAAEDIDIPEEKIQQQYEKYTVIAEEEGRTLLPFEEVKDDLEEELRA